MAVAYVGVGANLGDRASTIAEAVRRLGLLPLTSVRAVSSLRETDPVGVLDQPRFLNGAVALETELEPRKLLEGLLDVERTLGRVRGARRFGPRTIDLDLLLYGSETVDEPGLAVPHPRLHERMFVLEPLAELEPGLIVPGRGCVTGLLRALRAPGPALQDSPGDPGRRGEGAL
jgi:2-amino-4-hydroxy-6-hydroxymethyldihydropteridine diphosphokinase